MNDDRAIDCEVEECGLPADYEVRTLGEDIGVGAFCTYHARNFLGADPRDAEEIALEDRSIALERALYAATPPASEPLRLAILVNQKVQPHQYESAEVSLHLGNLTLATPDEEIDALLERGRLAYDRMAKDVGARAKGARDKGGFA